MSLQEKVIKLKMNAAKAWCQASWWQNLIEERGENAAVAFYTHLGLNHLEKKSVEWEGLVLSREPKEHEKIAVKGIAQAQESAKESISKVLLSLRETLISDGLKGIEELTPATYHTLVLETPPQSRNNLRDRLTKVYRQGRRLVASELSRTKQDDDEDGEEFDDLDTLTDLTDSRVANEVQSRITGAAARFALLGLVEAALLSAIQQELADGSVSYIDRSAGEAAHRVVGLGRRDEMRDREDTIDRFEYSSLLDLNTCEACFSLDGTTANSLDELPEVPLAECEGGGMCRCFIVAVSL